VFVIITSELTKYDDGTLEIPAGKPEIETPDRNEKQIEDALDMAVLRRVRRN
jgi:hypothetical protein